MGNKRELSSTEVKEKGLNPVFKHYESPIERDGKIIGYHKYANSGIFNSLKFTGYRWL